MMSVPETPEQFEAELEMYAELDELARHYFRSVKPAESLGGEFEHLEKLFSPDRLNIDGGFAVDMAASDGVCGSCTLRFFGDRKWPGLAIEMNAELFAKLAFVYAKFPWVRLARGRVTPGNVGPMLNAFDVPKDFALLNLDIDSYDLRVLESILDAGFKPKLVSMEVNEKIPPPVYFSVDYSDDHYWQGDHFYGCSLSAASELMKPRGYVLESLQCNNAFFVESDAASRAGIRDREVAEAYRDGYANIPDRKALFEWNADVDCLLTMKRDESVEFIRNYFSKYTGMFTLR